MLKIFLFWVDKGVTTFRVDNPHTKPVPFWEWVIAQVHRQHPDVIFLAEAFTKPKMMRLLAKVGFAQSYTYFTWRNEKHELTEYVNELTNGEMKEYFHRQLLRQHARHPAADPAVRRPAGVHHARRAGGDPVLGLRHLQWLRAVRKRGDSRQGGVPRLGEVRDQGARLEGAGQHRRHHHPHQPDPPRIASPADGYNNVLFLATDNPKILAYAKMTEDRSDIIVCASTSTPSTSRSRLLQIPLGTFGIGWDEQYQAHDLLSDETLPLERPDRLRRTQPAHQDGAHHQDPPLVGSAGRQHAQAHCRR
jgi:starch synthase (maltosyl-transferring)